jgi:hypothetical protein
MALVNLSAATRSKRDDALALEKIQQAIEIAPNVPWYHANCATQLYYQGRFHDAVIAEERARELGRRNPTWVHPSEQMLRKYRRIMELDTQFPDVPRIDTSNLNDLVLLADLCEIRRYYGTATRCWDIAFTNEPQLARHLHFGFRYRAACSAALAAFGQGREGESLSNHARHELRNKALSWLNDELDAYTQLLDSDLRMNRFRVRKALRQWQNDPFLSRLRDECSSRAVQTQNDANVQLWQRVDQIMAKIDEHDSKLKK